MMEMEYVPLEEKKRLEGILLLKMRQRVSTRIKGSLLITLLEPRGW